MHDDEAAGQDRTPKKASHVAAWWVPFLSALAESGNVSHACLQVQIARSTAYEARERHEEFAAAWDEAVEFAADAMELEARRRAVEGTDEPVFYKGMKVGTIRRYSDTLLIFLLKAARPTKYRERVQLDIARHLDLTKLSDEQLEQLAAGEDPLRVILGSGAQGASGGGAPEAGH